MLYFLFLVELPDTMKNKENGLISDLRSQTKVKQSFPFQYIESVSTQVDQCIHCLLNGRLYPKLPRTYEPRYKKTGFLHMRKQRRRSASR